MVRDSHFFSGCPLFCLEVTRFGEYSEEKKEWLCSSRKKWWYLTTKMCSETKPLFHMVAHCVSCQKGKFGQWLEGEYRHKLNFIQFNIKVISSTAQNIIILTT
jgi:hypothetical protein